MTSFLECQKIKKERVSSLLNFLKEEIYSDRKTLMQVTNYTCSRRFYRFIKKFTLMGLIQKHEFEAPTGKLSLWGITNDGLAMVIQPEDSVFPARFEPNKLKGWSMQHHLLNQQVRLTLESKGGTNWVHGDRKNFLKQYDVKHRPDGLITLQNGQKIAIETERSLKTKQRYQEIMKSHLVARKAEKWHFVYYVLPDEQKKIALKKMFDDITFLTFSGRPIPIEPSHREVFKFYTVDELAALPSLSSI